MVWLVVIDVEGGDRRAHSGENKYARGSHQRCVRENENSALSWDLIANQNFYSRLVLFKGC